MSAAPRAKPRGARARKPARGIPLVEMRAREFGARLRAWYRRNARDLPWRRSRDPYRILVSELMLQQTQVGRVLEYWPRFHDRFPSLEANAKVGIGVATGNDCLFITKGYFHPNLQFF